MKKQLLLLISTVLLTVSFSNAQVTTWDFGNDSATWPLSTGIGNNPMVVANLGLYPITAAGGNTNFGAVTASSASFPDGFTAVNRFQMNGGGFTSATGFTVLPTQRYLFVDVSGSCSVSVWFKTGSNGAVRTMYVTDGVATVGSLATNTGTTADLGILTANYTGAATRLYIFGDLSCNLYKVSVTGASVNTTLANDSFELSSSVNVHANGKQVLVSNVKSDAKIEVFNMLGALVKSVNTSSDISIDMETAGFYIVNVTSKEGKKSTKVSIN